MRQSELKGVLAFTSSRHSPLKSWEPRVIAIQRDPFAPGLDSQGRTMHPAPDYRVRPIRCKGVEKSPSAAHPVG